MDQLLPPLPLLLAFLGASLALALTPGPGVLYIVARTLAQGRASGLASVAGVGLGNFANALLAAFGVAALLAVSALAFEALKWAGALYLIWLGLQQWRSAATLPALDTATVQIAPASTSRTLREGIVVSLLNPKTTLFFAAFLPQFISASGLGAMAQSVTLSALFVAIAACTDSAYVLLAAWVAPRLTRARGAQRWGKRAAGSAFIGLGLLTALSGRR
ncbi:MAG: LysE family translocator [Burkholderiales bacterium]|nr:LysE family translocator [Burkholderiales bacterium]